ncbi:hypothetical protein INT48_007492 [Thamnidium elegans]|uniref:Uncharacterized protein n=1 Tax=Thamnidium elegans TaxID=101142 RepID=A0A8H7VU07_9FUNG|nr:hypothetical protein INT48_007492 [Thamnidium elegans]
MSLQKKTSRSSMHRYTVNSKSCCRKMPPGSAFKRLDSKKFWEDVFNECIAKERSNKTNTVSKNFQDSALDLLDEAREVSVSNIRKRLRDTANQEGESSTSTSVNNISVLNDNPFLDHTPTERVRSKIINFRIHADHVVEIHKQDLLSYGLIDLVPSSSTKLRATIEEPDLNEIIDLAKKKALLLEEPPKTPMAQHTKM